MAAVSQALREFANHRRPRSAPGIEVIETGRYVITLQPDFPIPGPNSISWIRCRRDEADDVIREARAIIAPRRLPVMWILDPETAPRDFGDRLVALGAAPDPRSPHCDVMALPVEVTIAPPPIADFEIRDALADLDTFRQADAVGAEAFGGTAPSDEPAFIASQERRRLNSIADGSRRHLLACVDGEPAGAGGMNVFPPAGATISGGGVRPKFRGRGVYRALVAARLEIARRAGVPGLAVWGGPESAPILARLGFVTVGWRRFYIDGATAQASDSTHA
jgi:GNAT superfamily N-acetyltransferase